MRLNPKKQKENEMKKIFATALAALFMTATITGCGPTKEENGNTTGTNNAETGEEHKEIEIVPTQEILDADMESFKVQIGNDFIVELPITLEKLMEKGVVIPDDVNPINEIVRKGTSETLDVTINGLTCQLGFGIFGEEYELQLKDCTLKSLDSGLYTGRYCPFVLPKGIKVGSTMDELKAAYGEPDSSELDYCEYNFYSSDKTLRIGTMFHFDIEKQVLTNISYSIYDETE